MWEGFLRLFNDCVRISRDKFSLHKPNSTYPDLQWAVVQRNNHYREIVNATSGITQSVTEMMDFELINIQNAKKIKNPV